jgi:hypothetical protein
VAWYPTHICFHWQIAFKKTVKVLGEGLGVKRRKKKADTSVAQNNSEGSISSQTGDDVEASVVGDGIADATSRAKHVAMDQRAYAASPDGSKSPRSGSPLWDVAADDVTAPLVTASETSISTTIGTNWRIGCQEEADLLCRLMTGSHGRTHTLPHVTNRLPTAMPRFAAVDAARETAFVSNTSFASWKSVPTQAQLVNQEMPWKASLGTQLPVAASLTKVFGNNEAGSSSDSGDDGKLKPESGNRTTK